METQIHNIFLKFGVALALGFLVGIQREYSRDHGDQDIPAGIRTFALMGLLGCTAAMVADEFNSVFAFVAIFLIAGLFVCISYFIHAWKGNTGLTTEFATLITLLAGVLVYFDYFALTIAIIVATTGLLSLKIEMHKFVRGLSRDDIMATLKFAVITAIVLPVLPNQNFGPEPFNIFNPFKIWLLVVLISGISFVGYILIKIIGAHRGIGLVGILGGLASSTAVTLTMTQRSRSTPELSRSFAQAILLAWTVMFVRLFIVVAAVNPKLMPELWLPILGGTLAGLLYCFFLFLKDRTTNRNEAISFVNPFELGPAIKFGLLFSVILLISKAAQIYLGHAGIYLASLVSGLADVDAISLSVADMSLPGKSLAVEIAGTAIIIASVSNTVLKGAVAAITGSPELRKNIVPGAVLMMTVVIALVFVF
jgi:uncharacterized membrane protein (DUF4010 family)